MVGMQPHLMFSMAALQWCVHQVVYNAASMTLPINAVLGAEQHPRQELQPMPRCSDKGLPPLRATHAARRRTLPTCEMNQGAKKRQFIRKLRKDRTAPAQGAGSASCLCSCRCASAGVACLRR